MRSSAQTRVQPSCGLYNICYDASAKTDGNPSLNECLRVGPKFNKKTLEYLPSASCSSDCRHREGVPDGLGGGK